MTILAWLGGLLVLVLLIATVVALVRLLVPRLSIAKGRASKIVLVLFALFGAVAVSSVAGMLVMHLGKRRAPAAECEGG